MAEHDRDQSADPGNELEELLAECLSVAEMHGDAGVDEFCAKHPGHAAVLRRRMQMLREAGLGGRPGADDEFPETLGEFRLLRRLGGGGMGVVFVAEQSTLGRRVALKLIRPEHLYFPGARARFAREAQAVARLAHPGIVQVHTVGDEAGVPFIAMELIDGVSLSEVLAELRKRDVRELTGRDLLEVLRERSTAPPAPEHGGPPFGCGWPDACAWIGRELAQALEHAHQRGVVHRDLKPSNVMLTAAGRVLLVDFGLASASGVDQVTRTGSALGSLPYMSPEQVDGRSDQIGARSDIYALGVTLYELVSLRRPFHESDETRLRAAILSARTARLGAVTPHVPRDLEAAIAVAMAPEPERRYQTAADFARDLSHVLAREPIEARPAGAIERARRWAQRHPAQALAGALAAVIVVGGPTGFGVFQSRAAAKERELGAELSQANRLAEQRNVELAAANAELEERREELFRSLENESRERERAEANFAHALEAVDTMLTRVGADKLQDVPQMEGVRRELLEDALGFYERFVLERADDPELRMRSAVTLRKVGFIRDELGDLAGALEALDESARTLRELEAAGDESAELQYVMCATLAQQASTQLALQSFDDAERTQRDLLEKLDALRRSPAHASYALRQSGTTHQHVAFLLRDTGRIDEAIDSARTGVELLREANELDPPSAERMQDLAVAILSLAIMEQGRVSAAENEGAILDALALMREACALDPEDPRLRETLASGLGNLGLLLSRQQLDHGYTPTGPDAESALRESVSIYRELIERFPLRALYRSGIASGAGNLCVHLARSGDLAGAREYAELALEAAEFLSERAPESADHRSQIGALECNLAMLDLSDGRAQRALARLERARTELEFAVAAEPRNPLFANLFRQWHIGQVRGLLEVNRWSEALEPIASFEGRNLDENAQLWSVEQRVRCMELADAAGEFEQSERIAEQAVERLARLVEGGYDRSRLAKRSSLGALRGREDFARLVGDDR